MLQIHEKVKQARRSAHLTQEAMAGRLGIKRSTYQYWEKETTSIENLNEVIRVLNLPDDYFFVNNDENKNATDGKSVSDDDIIKSGKQDYNEKTMYHLSRSNEKNADANLILTRLLEHAMTKPIVGADGQTTGEILDSIRGLQNYVAALAHTVTGKPLKEIKAELYTMAKEVVPAVEHKDNKGGAHI